jgi:hypothetical protein
MHILLNSKNEIIAYANDFVIYEDHVDAYDIQNNITHVVTDLLNPPITKYVVPTSFRVPIDFEPYKYLYIQNKLLPSSEYRLRHYSVKQETTPFLYQYLPDDYKTKLIDFYVEEFINYLFFLKSKHLLPDNISRGLEVLNESNLTGDDLEYQKLLKNMLFKLRARYVIELEVGDISDLNADNNKQINVITGMLVRMYRKLISNVEIPPAIKSNYDTFTEMYGQAVDSGQYKDRTDLENPQELIMKLMERNAIIANIVNTEYFSKKL